MQDQKIVVLFYKVGKITLYLYSKVRKSIIIQYEPHCKPRSWLQNEWAFKKPFFCMSNVCLLPCDALFLRCIGVDGAIFVGRSPVPFKSKRGQLQNKINISMQPFIFFVLSTLINRISNPICLSLYMKKL